jgi:hypothetical protein
MTLASGCGLQELTELSNFLDSTMKLNSTAAFTLILLTLMFAAGLVSAAGGLSIGQEALKGITQPDTRPTNNVPRRPSNANRQKEFVPVKEEEILAAVKERIGSTSRARQSTPSTDKTDKDKTAAKSETAIKGNFPMTTQSQGVVLAINSVTKQGDSLVLKVNLRNTGKQSVQFLYSFLNVTDERGRALSASTDGLPAELPASSESFTGTISVPTALLDRVRTLSLDLTDYPDQQLQLKVADIPIVP